VGPTVTSANFPETENQTPAKPIKKFFITMKSRIAKIGLLLFTVTGVVAWNTTNLEDLVMGTPNTTASAVGQLGVIGRGNSIKGRSVLVIGDSNQMSQGVRLAMTNGSGRSWWGPTII
jgi:hypothetical protein